MIDAAGDGRAGEGRRDPQPDAALLLRQDLRAAVGSGSRTRCARRGRASGCGARAPSRPIAPSRACACAARWTSAAASRGRAASRRAPPRARRRRSRPSRRRSRGTRCGCGRARPRRSASKEPSGKVRSARAGVPVVSLTTRSSARPARSVRRSSAIASPGRSRRSKRPSLRAAISASTGEPPVLLARQVEGEDADARGAGGRRRVERVLARAVAVRRQRRHAVREQQDRLGGAGGRARAPPRRLGLQRELRGRDRVAEVGAAQVAREVLAQRVERLVERLRAAADLRQHARLVRERDETDAIARPGFEPRQQRARRGELGGEHAVVEVLAAQPIGEARRQIGLGEQAREQGGIGAAVRAVAVHVPARRQQAAVGDVEHDHELVDARAARGGLSAHLDQRQRAVDSAAAGASTRSHVASSARAAALATANATRRSPREGIGAPARVLPRPARSAMLAAR